MKRKKPTKGFIVAIDGPAGAGKSTVSLKLAKSLKGRLLDTGATYRSLAFFALNECAETEIDLVKIAKRLKFSPDRTGVRLLTNKKYLGKKIRSEKVSSMASWVSRFPRVRAVLTKKQRELAKAWSKSAPVVVEGRDIGTVVFPKVKFKFYVTADAKVRARRRFEQLQTQGKSNITYSEVLAKVRARDAQDSQRKVAPLKRARDAVLLDTSEMELNEVVKTIKRMIYED